MCLESLLSEGCKAVWFQISKHLYTGKNENEWFEKMVNHHCLFYYLTFFKKTGFQGLC